MVEQDIHNLLRFEFYGKVVTATFTVEQYELSVNEVGQGSMDIDPPGPYFYNDVVTLTATAEPHWNFAGWSGAASGSNITTTVTMTSNKEVTATFTANQYQLSVNEVGQGSVGIDPTGPYFYNNVVTLTATADPGWTFAGWSGAAAGSNATTTVTMTGDKQVTTTFTADQYQLSINIVGQGSLDIDPLGPYFYNDVVTLTATADPGWIFGKWSSDASGSNITTMVTMTSDKEVMATFNAPLYLPLILKP